MVFAHTNESTPRGVDNGIRISALRSLCDRTRCPTLILPVQLLVVKVGKKNGFLIGEDPSATVLVHKNYGLSNFKVIPTSGRSL
jgi:hypothetical protein